MNILSIIDVRRRLSIDVPYQSIHPHVFWFFDKMFSFQPFPLLRILAHLGRIGILDFGSWFFVCFWTREIKAWVFFCGDSCLLGLLEQVQVGLHSDWFLQRLVAPCPTLQAHVSMQNMTMSGLPQILGGGLNHFLFSPLSGEMIQVD